MDWSYKTKDDVDDFEYLLPGSNNSPAIVSFNYLCSKAKSPWVFVADSENSSFYVNRKSILIGYRKFYGKVFSFVLSEKTYGLVETLDAYVSCKPRKFGLHEREEGTTISTAILKEMNPGSIGQEIADIFCHVSP